MKKMLSGRLVAGADISSCSQYRYRLWRDFRGSPNEYTCLFIMLNPSTADGSQDDPTIRKCVGFCKRWGYGMLIVCNLFAFRSTKPAGLLGVADPVGPDNDGYIRAEARVADRIVLAWGSHHEVKSLVDKRAAELKQKLNSYAARTVVLGRCK